MWNTVVICGKHAIFVRVRMERRESPRGDRVVISGEAAAASTYTASVQSLHGRLILARRLLTVDAAIAIGASVKPTDYWANGLRDVLHVEILISGRTGQRDKTQTSRRLRPARMRSRVTSLHVETREVLS